MPHSFNKIWIHAIWSTKERYPLIIPSAEKKVYDLMKDEFIDAGCPVRIINGMPDHIHCLFLLNPNKAVTDIVKQVKGSCSHEINKQNITKEKFSWQTGYAAYSVSESVLEKVFQYIKNQKQHHKKINFQKEYEDFIRLHGLQNGMGNG
jgi:REP element-mobilizing transposase RayT